MELNEKLARWAGFTMEDVSVIHEGREGVIESISTPNGKQYFGDLPDFTDPEFGITYCFKWLVPKRITEITFMYASNCVSCDIEDLEGNFFEGHVNTESIEEAWTKSALALCLATEKLIDEDS